MQLTREQALSEITPGRILYLNAPFPPNNIYSNKHFVVVGEDENLLLLKINTENKYTQHNKRLNERQFKLKKKPHYPFLDYDSYLDCGTVWFMLSKDDALNQLMRDHNRVKGQLYKPHENEVLRLTALSRSIAPKLKRIIAESF